MYIDGEDFAYGVLCTIAGGLGVVLVGLLSHFVNVPIVCSNFAKAQELLEEQRIDLGSTIAEKAGISNFNVASLELAKNNNDYIMKAFGSTSVEKIIGLKENNYLNIYFNISNTQAQKILDAIEKANQTKLLEQRNSIDNINAIRDVNEWNYSESNSIKKATEACSEVYNLLNEAVQNAYSCSSENISESSAMNNSISREYRYARPEVLSDVNISGLFVSGGTTFINSGVVTTGISQVVKDIDNNVSYFLIDTLQGRDEDGKIVLESCRARVEVKGTNLTQEEVYAKFINGEHSSFTEIVREKSDNKAGVVNNQIQEDVDDVILF